MPASTSVDDTEARARGCRGAWETAITKICDHKCADEDRFNVVMKMRRCCALRLRASCVWVPAFAGTSGDSAPTAICAASARCIASTEPAFGNLIARYALRRRFAGALVAVLAGAFAAASTLLFAARLRPFGAGALAANAASTSRSAASQYPSEFAIAAAVGNPQQIRTLTNCVFEILRHESLPWSRPMNAAELRICRARILGRRAHCLVARLV